MIPTNLLTLIGDLAESWATASGVPALYAGLSQLDPAGLRLIIDAPTLDYSDSPACDAGPAAITVPAYLVATSTDPGVIADLYARIIPVVAALPAGWTLSTVTPTAYPPGEAGSPAYRIDLSYS
jgi:hypothetical protein